MIQRYAHANSPAVYSEPLRSQIQNLPKIDLHRHLTGSISARSAIEVATRHGLPLPTFDLFELEALLTIRAQPGSLRDYFKPWSILNNLFVSSQTTFELVSHVLIDAAADKVEYLELRMAPRSLVGNSALPLPEFISAAANAVTQTPSPVTRCILGLPRHALLNKSEHELHAIFRRVMDSIRDDGKGVFVGVDLNGDESLSDGRAFRTFFATARQSGLHVTIHAGELGDSENVRIALAELGATRVGHGTAALGDWDVAAELARRGTVLELCPTSNVFLGTIESIAALPVYFMQSMGIRYTVNTDNPARCGITLSDELYAFARAFDLTLEDVKMLTAVALQAAFVDEATKRLLDERINAKTSLRLLA